LGQSTKEPGAMLKISNLHVSYGNIHVLFGINMEVEEGEVIALVGSNGAGKSTLIKSISGIVKPNHGEILFENLLLNHLDYSQIVHMGIIQVPEGRRLFYGLTIEENLRMGAYQRKEAKEVSQDLKKIYNIFPILSERKNQLAGTLSGGEQQMCALARGLMGKPKLLIIDELSLGLAPMVVEHLYEIIDEIKTHGISIIIVEQDVGLALKHSDRGYVLETGSIVLGGNSNQLINNEFIKRAYLGL
jgi:branched-chain amino acid transport system ATP-binding protein